MVIIRLSRGGAKKRPFYDIVVTDSRNKRDGRCIERIGNFTPVRRVGQPRITLNMERVQYWVSVGAQLSQRVSSLIKEYKKESTATGVTTGEAAA